MKPASPDTMARLQKDILLQYARPKIKGQELDIELGAINHAFPFGRFPIGAVHEFCCTGEEGGAANSGFIAGLMASLMKEGGIAVWISSSGKIFPPALTAFGIDPGRVVFITLSKESDRIWAMEEALKCAGIAAVVGEIAEMSFTNSRRLQLAVEQSRVTGFLIRQDVRNLTATACFTRWKIHAIPSEPGGNLPGIGFPRWKVELQRVRNGKPGCWQLEWSAGRFRSIPGESSSNTEQQKKAV